jgi:hypothetical protein
MLSMAFCASLLILLVRRACSPCSILETQTIVVVAFLAVVVAKPLLVVLLVALVQRFAIHPCAGSKSPSKCRPHSYPKSPAVLDIGHTNPNDAAAISCSVHALLFVPVSLLLGPPLLLVVLLVVEVVLLLFEHPVAILLPTGWY